MPLKMLKQKLLVVAAGVGVLLGFAFYGISFLQDKREIAYFQSLASKHPEGETYVAQLLQEREKLNDQDPSNDFSAYAAIGVSLNILGEKKEALQRYEKALVLDATNLLVLNNMADIFSDLGQYGEAETHWLKLTQLYPEKTMFWRALGYLYRYRMQKTSYEIEEFFKRGLNVTNNDPDLVNWLISYFEETGNNEKFVEYANMLAQEPKLTD